MSAEGTERENVENSREKEKEGERKTRRSRLME